MPWTVAHIVLALAAATASPRTAPQITHTEGVVDAGRDGIRVQDGRAEALFADGSVLHLDRYTSITYDGDRAVALTRGRLFVRTTGNGAIDVELPIATVRLAPRGAYSILLDAAHESLLVSVSVGHADIQTRYGSAQVAGRQMAMMTGATSRPFATPYEPATWDSFTQWSDERMTTLAYGPRSPWTVTDLARTGLIVDRPKESSLTCSSWLAFDNPCWVILAPVPVHPSRHRAPYAPRYAPDYEPKYGAGPAPAPLHEPTGAVHEPRGATHEPRGAVHEPGVGAAPAPPATPKPTRAPGARSRPRR